MGANNVSSQAVNFQHVNPSNKRQCQIQLAHLHSHAQPFQPEMLIHLGQPIWGKIKKLKQTNWHNETTRTRKFPPTEHRRMDGQN